MRKYIWNFSSELFVVLKSDKEGAAGKDGCDSTWIRGSAAWKRWSNPRRLDHASNRLSFDLNSAQIRMVFRGEVGGEEGEAGGFEPLSEGGSFPGGEEAEKAIF